MAYHFIASHYKSQAVGFYLTYFGCESYRFHPCFNFQISKYLLWRSSWCGSLELQKILASNRQLARKSSSLNVSTVYSAEGYCTLFFSSRFFLCASREKKLNPIAMK